MNTPSTASMSSSIPRGPPGVVTFRYQHEMGSEMAYVPLPATHEEAQDLAARSFPTLLASVDPSWLFFTIAIRYKSSGERKEIGISPNAWYYVTSKLVPYRLIDVHVIPPSSPRSSASRSYAPLYTDSPSKQAPPYPESVSSQSNVPPYPDSPPPRYPGSPKKQLHPHLTPTGYGYGFGWHDQTQSQDAQAYPEPQLYPEPRVARTYEPYHSDPQEVADRRSTGWSGSSVRMTSPGWNGIGLFSSIRERLFPINWSDSRKRRRRQEHRTRTLIPEYENEYEHASGSGRSYVPSLI